MQRAVIAVVLAIAIASPLVAARADPGGEPPRRADFKVEVPSDQARTLADWVVASRDHQNLPFAIIDKTAARVFVFARDGSVAGAAAALLGSAVGDDSAPGIGQRRLTAILPHERTTPAGRYQAALGHDLDQDILWIDYDKALSLHRVIDGKAKDRRRQRLATPTAGDNRISYGCINVPEAFYDGVVAPAFAGTVGIVYILPETRDLAEVFPAMRAPQR
ncbi:L,D-transpeptidase [Sphingomonas sp. S1-29]|uniref:L,D-transpeptidase n=1 Tax=Sphingomonas sp. S1-29 TaxID=2991074 RepID=UPI0022403D76|nr:L,D-transpeptidase [Sphingomonas sp. S1-29]UZK69916.1 L,D-transpeptidase [Sphingomonas sp. S1-29]